RPSWRSRTSPARFRTPRCFETAGCETPARAVRAATVCSPSRASRSKIARRVGSARLFNNASVVVGTANSLTCGYELSNRPFQSFGGLEHLVGVAVDLHLAPDVEDDALAVDQEGRPLDAHIFLAVHALLDPNAVGLGYVAVLIRGKRKGELEFLL